MSTNVKKHKENVNKHEEISSKVVFWSRVGRDCESIRGQLTCNALWDRKSVNISTFGTQISNKLARNPWEGKGLRTVKFSRLLNRDWPIQISGTPA